MTRVDLRRRGIQIARFLSVVSGCGFALLLVRIFAVGHIASAWMLLGELLLVVLAAYLISISRRAIFYGKGKPLPAARFGWGRMLLGAELIFSAANTYFHLFPRAHFRRRWNMKTQLKRQPGTSPLSPSVLAVLS